MCGRFTLTEEIKAIAKQFGVTLPPPFASYAPRFNIAPTQSVIVVTAEGQRQMIPMRWGLIPSWAKDPSFGNRLINARAETLAVKPSFRNALRQRRCLIPADGFYEWQKLGQVKQPMHIALKNRSPFGLAGLWDRWKSPAGEEILSCTIITTRANELLQQIHDRMPVILPPAAQAVWLDSKIVDLTALVPWLKPYPSREMQYYPVSTLVNSPANDREECVMPVATADARSMRSHTHET